MLEPTHSLKLRKTRDEKARMNFVSGIRAHVLNDMANGMRAVWEADVEPEFRRKRRRGPKDGPEVHGAMKSNEYFKFYSTLRVTAQDLVWQSVFPPLDRERDRLKTDALELRRRSKLGSLTLAENFEVPRYVSAIDVHLMAGNYDGEYDSDDVTAGSLYDNGLAVFSFGLMGKNLDDIGQSIAGFVRRKFPQLAPKKILDLGCTIGHNTGSWKDAFPNAEVHGIDVAAPCLRYAHARAQAQGRAVHFHQMNAEYLDFPDASFDVVFSSMFLHEIPKKSIPRILAEAHRVLKPGGLMLHMELPPNSQLSPYDAFYLDWDSTYNNEPFYKPFRDLKPEKLCRDAGFDPKKYVQFVIPSIGWYGEKVWAGAVAQQGEVDSDKTGRLTDGVMWYSFGAFK
ncbi:MAG: class I SAM-dependent methyltransferase [Gammaproteobacteria bacterium]|jgi:SAM-dependent methyltransferase|nr:class I SAM-dependent methyltransferase [Gammaproteobacteria bacterium]